MTRQSYSRFAGKVTLLLFLYFGFVSDAFSAAPKDVAPDCDASVLLLGATLIVSAFMCLLTGGTTFQDIDAKYRRSVWMEAVANTSPSTQDREAWDECRKKSWVTLSELAERVGCGDKNKLLPLLSGHPKLDLPRLVILYPPIDFHELVQCNQFLEVVDAVFAGNKDFFARCVLNEDVRAKILARTLAS